MKKVGIIGGIGPESTIDYYQSIIMKYQDKVGSKEVLPELLINSIDMYQIFEFLQHERIQELTHYLTNAVKQLKRGGADFVVMSGNTPHIVFEQVQKSAGIPMISIVEETCLKAKELNLERVGLLGTKFTMKHDFFKELFYAHKMDLFVPNQEEQQYIHRKIVEELEKGIVNEETKQQFLTIIHRMIDRDNLQGMILGCTELPMIIQQENLTTITLNTTDIHVNKIVEALFS